jgi:hypothetical protein
MQILDKEIQKDKMETENSKRRMIDEIKAWNKEEMFVEKRVSFWDKLLKVLGYGKKR